MKHEIQHLDSISRLAAATHESANPKYELDAEIGFNKTSDWRSIYVASFLGFCTALQLALFNSSIWSYLSTIDNTATEQFFGYMVSAFSVGEMIGSPLAGYFSNRFHRVSHILYVGIVFLFAGNIIYSCAELLLPGKAKFVLLISHTLTGFGYSTNSLLQAYASMASVPKDRSRAIACVTGGMALGGVTGPAFQLLLTTIEYPGWTVNVFGIIQWRVSMYTAPSYMARLMNIIGAVSVYSLFRENYAGILYKENEPITIAGQKLIVPRYDLIAVLVCAFTRFSKTFIETTFNTLVTPLSGVIFSWENQKIVQVEATAEIVMNILAFLTYTSYIVFRLDKLWS